MYPFKYKDIWILGATWINHVGVVVVRNSYEKGYEKGYNDHKDLCKPCTC